eukprot:Amastigsp_a509966_56.p2 type:complete len:301 gc:universal Amastigsp_a509966_56:24-926(+)
MAADSEREGASGSASGSAAAVAFTTYEVFCVRCHAPQCDFLLADCVFHGGRVEGDLWSCCQGRVGTAPGCESRSTHEAPRESAQQRHARDELPPAYENDDAALAAPDAPPPPPAYAPTGLYGATVLANGSSVARHLVARDDTLIGIAMRYGTTTERLKQLNRLGSDKMLHALTEIVVPVTNPAMIDAAYQAPPLDPVRAEEIRLQKIFNAFRRATHATDEAANYYLGSCEYELEKALAEWRADEEWAAVHGEMPESRGGLVRGRKIVVDRAVPLAASSSPRRAAGATAPSRHGFWPTGFE